MSPLVAARSPIAPPHPPPDAALPALSRALDPEAAAEALQGWLGRSGLVVRSCAPAYIRYKPGTNATIRYDVEIAAGTDEWRHWVVARLLHDHLAEEELARRRVGRLVAVYDQLAGVPPSGEPAVVLPELGAFALLFPLDPKLPGLAAALAPEYAAELMGGEASSPSGLLPAPVAVRYKPLRKALLRLDAGSSTDGRDFYIKLSLPEVAPVLDRRARAFAVALRDRGVSTAAPAAWLPAIDATTYPAMPGVPLRAMRGTADVLATLPDVASAVQAIGACDVANLPPYLPVDEIATLRSAADTLRRLLPELVPDLDDLVLALQRGLSGIGGDLRPAHGDCYDDQFLAGPEGLTLLDFDEARLAYPSLDPGNYLAHLHAATTDAPDDESRRNLDRAIEYLVGRWAPLVGEDALAVASAAGILKLAVGPFRRLEASWPRRITALVARADACLPHARPVAVRRANDGGGDAGLPGLRRALDPVWVAALLRQTGTRAGTPRLGEPEIVKHRRGRRAVVRYPLALPGDKHVAVYVKVFANDRAERVAARTTAIHAAVGDRLVTPRVLGLDPASRMVILSGVVGRPLDALVRGEESDGPVRAGAALAVLHASQAHLETRHDADDELAATAHQLAGLSELDAELRHASGRVYDIVAGALRRLEPWRFRPAHRDCYPAQVLVGPDGIGFVDLDDACLTEPAIDVGNMLAHLDLDGLLSPTAADGFARAAEAFLAGYSAGGGTVAEGQVAVCRAVALLRLAGVHAPRAGVPLGFALVEAALARLVGPHSTAA